ncbi:MAG TPA: helix-turn-helix domain-containing protein [Thermoanaerobaculia bacterium]|nr:helix-turn-helix domain-containing protein [Thermoanaerobaculia bacterium]
MKTLIVDKDTESRDALRRAFQSAGEQVRSFESAWEGRRHLADFQPDVVVVAVGSERGEEWAFLSDAARDPARAVFAAVETARLEDGVDAMTRGAADWLWLPVSDARLRLLLSRLAERRERERLGEQMRQRLARGEMATCLVGNSERWKEALAAIEREASSGGSALITGEPGTEKREAARTLHLLSLRGGEPLITATESTLPADDGRRMTIFVPAVENWPLEEQRAIVREIEGGGSRRWVLATDLEPMEAAASGKLHPALLESLREHTVHLPPLRERAGDVGMLARQFLSEQDASLFFDAEAIDALSAHDWPGNSAELHEAVSRAAALTDRPGIGSTIVLSVLPRPRAARRSRRKKPPVVRIPVGASLADVERRLIQKTLEFARGSKPKTAELLKLSLKTIYNKIKEYGLEH